LPIAEANILDYLELKNGKLSLKTLENLKREHGAAIASIKIEESSAIDLKLHNKTEAVNVLLRSVGAFVEKHEHDIGEGLGERLKAAFRRAEQYLKEQRALGNMSDAALNLGATFTDGKDSSVGDE
jgi:hypothetical protein